LVGRGIAVVDADADASPAVGWPCAGGAPPGPDDCEGVDDDEHPADRRINAARTLK